MKTRLILLSFAIALSAGVWLAPRGPARGVLAVLLLFFAVGLVIRWLANRGRQLSSSGRDPHDLSEAALLASSDHNV